MAEALCTYLRLLIKIRGGVQADAILASVEEKIVVQPPHAFFGRNDLARNIATTLGSSCVTLKLTKHGPMVEDSSFSLDVMKNEKVLQ